MAHPEQLAFISLAKEHFIDSAKGTFAMPVLNVLEIGSFDVNGSVRSLFDGCNYLGADLTPGPGVDLVKSGHEIDFPPESFDLTISCECFEHNPYWLETFLNMHRMTKLGGLVVFTCASKGRIEHGTLRTLPDSSPGTQAIGLNYYRNLTAKDFERPLELKLLFDSYQFFYIPTSYDLYFIGQKKGGSTSIVDLTDFASSVTKIRHFEKSPTKRALMLIYRIPLDILMNSINEKAYQNVAVYYSKFAALIWRSIKMCKAMIRTRVDRSAKR